MNTKKKWFTAVSCAIVALSVCTACQDDDLNQQPTDPATNVHTYRIVADVDAAPDGKGTRALTEDASNVIHSNWLQNDKMIAYCLNDKDNSKEKQYSLLQNATAGKGSHFDGTFKSVNSITTNDEICFFYPGAASAGKDATINSTKRFVGNGNTAPEGLVYYERQPTIMQTVELNLTEQDGTAKTIGEKFDYQWAKAKPAAVNGKDVKVKWVKMQRQIAIWGLRFASKDAGILNNIDSIYITGVKSLDVFDLGKGQFIADNPNDESDNIVLKPANNGKFTSADGKYTYAAILPGSFARVLITVFVGNKCYAREYANVNLEADKVYRTDVINMDQVVANPCVEVQGVKWATGNFIHYVQSSTGKEYWGIAPTQWWISQCYIKDTKTGLWTTSQFTSSPVVTPEDLDLFRYGDINDPANVTAGHFKQGFINIAKKFYAEYGPLMKEVPYGSNVKYGDIVWYYTKDNNQKYRMPTGDELQKLYNDANVIPAYCYSNHGLRIYGAFFYTNTGGTRKKTFPTRPNALYKYSNVTALVRANKGLFLPITGRRPASSASVGFRDMTYGGGAYGQYMSSTSNSSMTAMDFFFGPTEWNYSGNGKAQAKAIRPVWDPSSNDTPNPVFDAFKDIH
ncbi:hypothetical protein [Prevotella disiens]|uniref:Lipoprotein n=1 Tax=Prevotella disiens TaxID=28130 RepID=A0A3E4QJK3_9BACT|nr:hypothetical protein [Prevotella disiens]RGK98252.1 hypothetical protein DXC89_07745 [Prevotella disiens]